MSASLVSACNFGLEPMNLIPTLKTSDSQKTKCRPDLYLQQGVECRVAFGRTAWFGGRGARIGSHEPLNRGN